MLNTLQAKLLLDEHRSKAMSRLDKIPGLVLRKHQQTEADLAALGEPHPCQDFCQMPPAKQLWARCTFQIMGLHIA